VEKDVNYPQGPDPGSVLSVEKRTGTIFDVGAYYAVLSPEYPGFLHRYTELPVLKRLSGVGLLCGTDWTPLYHNSFFYSRLDHSIGVALVLWHFTHDRIQTLAGLLHDISTPAFSHVADFRNGDALTQETTENANAAMVRKDQPLNLLLAEDGLSADEVADYHRYPLADNDIPQLSADRLEYMFPSGMILDGSWDMEHAAVAYGDLVLCRNEYGAPEPGFRTAGIAADYCFRCCNVGQVCSETKTDWRCSFLQK